MKNSSKVIKIYVELTIESRYTIKYLKLTLVAHLDRVKKYFFICGLLMKKGWESLALNMFKLKLRVLYGNQEAPKTH